MADTPARHVYTGNGNIRVFPIPTRIIGDDYVRIEIDGIHLTDRTQWDIVNNSVIFLTAPINGSEINIQVATSEEALSVLGSVTNVDIVADNIEDINDIANSITNINTTATNIVDVNIVAGNTTNVNTVADNMNSVVMVVNDLTNINAVASNKTNIDIAASNITEIQNASANASIATTKALEASNSATSAHNSSVSAGNSSASASNSKIKANKWADNNYNVEVEAGKYSAKHWATVSQNSIGVKVVENISSLKTFNISESNQIELLGYYNKGDGGGGFFYFDNTSTETDNGGTIIQATGVATGRWKRVYSGAVNVKWFGAQGNGIQNDTTAFQAAHDAALNLGGGGVHIPSGHYRVQGVEFAPGVLWKGEGHLATKVQVIDNPLAGVGIFRCISDAAEFTSILFEDFAIIGDGTASWYKPSGATVPGIDFSTNVADAKINQCYFNRLFIQYCTTGIYLDRSVRQAPISGCRFWNNNLGLYIGNEHPVLEACEFRYNNIGVDGTIQDMDVMHSRFAYNRVGWRAETSRSAFVSCKFWQNKEIGIDRLNEYNQFSSCIFKGAGTFWSNIDGEPNESVCIGWYSRGNTITSSLFWGGNGKAMIELRSNNLQVGGGVSDSTIILSDGHFLEKVGSGAYTGLKLKDNDFIVTSVGDAEGAMIVRVPSNVSGSFSYFKFHDNFIRNEGVTQIHDFIVIAQTAAGGHTFHGNTFQAQSGVCGGINVYDNASTQYIGNTFRSGNYLNKIYIRSKQAGMSVKDNVGFTSETSGTSAIPTDATEVVVYHGLDVEPVMSSISITRGGGGGSASKYWIESMPGSGSFKIRCDVPPGQSPMTFYWNISSHRLI